MAGEFTFVKGRIIGGDMFTLSEIREKVKPLGTIMDFEGRGFRLIPIEPPDSDVAYPTIYFNEDYTLDIVTTGLKYIEVREFIEMLADRIGLPIDYPEESLFEDSADKKRAEDIEDIIEKEREKLNKFFEEFGGKSWRTR
ncbi:MAG: hypothetical protein J7J16_02355 [Deltaproteobacteria bacterium]|nr:hypothetical protein [Deltaproteobacteria bacterium]